MQCITGGKTSTFTYGADGLRRSMTVDDGTNPPVTTDYLLDGQSVVQEFNETTLEGVTTLNLTATYMNGPRGIEYRQDDTISTPKRSWYLYDGLGSVVAEVDEGDSLADPTVVPELTAKPLTDVYGKALTPTPAAKHGFVGGLGHTTDAVMYMRARYYDPQIGRFVSEDPGGNGTNWYAYCGNNPVNMLDRDGKMPVLAAVVLIALVCVVLAEAVYAIGCAMFHEKMTWKGAGLAALGGLGVAAAGIIMAVAGAAAGVTAAAAVVAATGA